MAVRHGHAGRLLLATHDLEAMRTINAMTNRSWGELHYAMFRSGYRPGYHAHAGIFYGKRMPVRQVFNDISMVNVFKAIR